MNDNYKQTQPPHKQNDAYLNYMMYPYYYYMNNLMFNNAMVYQQMQQNMLRDYGPEPFVTNIDEMTKSNTNFRTATWTGDYLQMTLMSIPTGESIGLEIHPETDQFIRIEDGQGLIMMGDTRDNLGFQAPVFEDSAIIIPAGIWHNLINTGNKPIKLYSIYSPPHHPYGTVHKTKQEALAYE